MILSLKNININSIKKQSQIHTFYKIEINKFKYFKIFINQIDKDKMPQRKI